MIKAALTQKTLSCLVSPSTEEMMIYGNCFKKLTDKVLRGSNDSLFADLPTNGTGSSRASYTTFNGSVVSPQEELNKPKLKAVARAPKAKIPKCVSIELAEVEAKLTKSTKKISDIINRIASVKRVRVDYMRDSITQFMKNGVPGLDFKLFLILAGKLLDTTGFDKVLEKVSYLNDLKSSLTSITAKSCLTYIEIKLPDPIMVRISELSRLERTKLFLYHSQKSLKAWKIRLQRQFEFLKGLKAYRDLWREYQSEMFLLQRKLQCMKGSCCHFSDYPVVIELNRKLRLEAKARLDTRRLRELSIAKAEEKEREKEKAIHEEMIHQEKLDHTGRIGSFLLIGCMVIQYLSYF